MYCSSHYLGSLLHPLGRWNCMLAMPNKSKSYYTIRYYFHVGWSDYSQQRIPVTGWNRVPTGRSDGGAVQIRGTCCRRNLATTKCCHRCRASLAVLFPQSIGTLGLRRPRSGTPLFVDLLKYPWKRMLSNYDGGLEETCLGSVPEA